MTARVGEFSAEAERVFNMLEEREILIREHEEDMAWASIEALPEEWLPEEE